jgi:drug/metabolite transporter (DMT)-like permease
MFYLIATILLNAVLFVFFKLFPRFKINSLQAIVANYWTCVVVGSMLYGSFPVGAHSVYYSWLPWSVLMGCMFISIFNLVAYSTIKDGITTATVANKLSLVIPVIFSLFLYDEKLTIVKIIGILIAFPAVYLTTRVKEEGKKGQDLFWPALLFLGSGLLDTLVKFVENNYLQDVESLVPFTIHTFATAGTIGVVLVAILAMRGKTKLHYRNIIAGIFLGIPNYFSIYYLVKLLSSDMMQSSAAIPVNNIGIVLACALCGILLFKEKAPATRIIGLVLSVAAILLIAFGD